MAFGDSITGGVLAVDCGLNRPQCSTAPGRRRTPEPAHVSIRIEQLLRMTATYSAAAYPNQLTTLLTGRYMSQSITMTNEGLAGEVVTESEAFDRFRAALTALRPEVVLLQEGVNDLHQFGTSAVPEIAKALRQMVVEAKSRGACASTSARCSRSACVPAVRSPRSLIAPANDQIRAMAAAEGVPLVDLYQAFGGQTSTLLGIDGLHPNEAGYQRMANTFFDAIQATLEVR